MLNLVLTPEWLAVKAAIVATLKPYPQAGAVARARGRRIGQLSVIDSMRDALETVRRRSAALRRSILEQAVAGEFVAHDPSDEPASVLLERIAAERTAAAPARRRRPSRRRATMGSP